MQKLLKMFVVRKNIDPWVEYCLFFYIEVEAVPSRVPLVVEGYLVRQTVNADRCEWQRLTWDLKRLWLWRSWNHALVSPIFFNGTRREWECFATMWVAWHFLASKVRTDRTMKVVRLSSFHGINDRVLRGIQHVVYWRGVSWWTINCHLQWHRGSFGLYPYWKVKIMHFMPKYYNSSPFSSWSIACKFWG